MSHETKPTAADLRGCAADRMYPIYPDARRFLLAGADAMDERDRLREKVDELECTLDDEEASGSESVAIINKLRAENAELAEVLRELMASDEGRGPTEQALSRAAAVLAKRESVV